MKIDVLCSSAAHPVWSYLALWVDRKRSAHAVQLIRKVDEASGGDILFLISCNEIVRVTTREKYRYVLVIHASDLPAGRGWSPLVWQIAEGCSQITLTLFEAVDAVDAGPVWKKERFGVEPHELIDEIHAKLFSAEISLMDYAVEHIDSIQPVPQPLIGGMTYYRKRTPEDSRIDPSRSIAEQFNLLRIADPERYPAFFDLHGHRYALVVRKIGPTSPRSVVGGKV